MLVLVWASACCILPANLPWHSSLPYLHACPGCPCPRACSPWPALDSMRGKVIVTLVLNGGTDMAARFQEAFPNLGACPPGSCQPAGVDRCLLHAPGMFLPLALWHCC